MSQTTTLIQRSEVDPYVELWSLDLTKLGQGIYYFVVSSNQPSAVTWGGQVYTPFDMEAEGFAWNGQGPPPTPKVKFATSNNVLTSLISGVGDLIGGKITRVRTFRRFLDDGSSPSLNEYFQKDIYLINQKTQETKFYVEFELAAPMDQQSITLPRGKLVYYCRFMYRYWIPASSTFHTYPVDVACPYTGSTFYDINNVVTTDPAKDQCSKRVTGCKARFGDGVLPFGGFPGTQVPVVGQ